MRIAIAQGCRPGFGALAASAAQAASLGARLLITPELSLTGYLLGPRAQAWEGEQTARRVGEIAAEHRLAVVYGVPERDGDGVHNTARLIGPDGAVLAAYRKTHLYGDQERATFTPGGQPVVQADLDGLRIGLLICYDVEFPETVRAHALAGTDLLAVPTALMRPYEFVPRVLVPARAYENGLHIAYANRCGPEGAYDFAGLSCLAGPDGEVRARAGAAPELLVADVDPALADAARADTPYLTDRRPDLYRTLARSPRP
ncbi:carbon-nitrogen hydrolase family protein [Actinacidiphila paucisporea]|uniref:Predicted amidohydrolase n=1 Tax=Actinacidiphila paucisporea TaxID=310782 RepID=A0A1M7QCU4_9ACTN|nr:Predicted amidohydrolase [Actinacidiphila paucisporea]